MKKPVEQKIVDLVCNVFEAHSTVLFLPNEKDERYYLAASFSLGNDISENAEISPNKGLVGLIINKRKPLIIAPFDQKQESIGYYEPDAEVDIKAFMGVPVPTGGALCVDSKKIYSFSEKDTHILQQFADLIARQQGLSQTDLGSPIPRYFTELSVIQDLRFRYKRWPEFLKYFLKSVKEAAEFEYAAFAVLENEEFYTIECETSPVFLVKGKQPQLPVGVGLVGWVFRNEQPVYAEYGGFNSPAAIFGKVPDIPDFMGVICMPVMVNKSCRGVLCLADTQPRQIDESRRVFIRQAVDYLSIFLENLYLRNRLSTFLPKTELKREGARIYNPDTAPTPRSSKDDAKE